MENVVDFVYIFFFGVFDGIHFLFLVMKVLLAVLLVLGIILVIFRVFVAESMYFAQGLFGVGFVEIDGGIPPWFVSSAVFADSYGVHGCIIYHF